MDENKINEEVKEEITEERSDAEVIEEKFRDSAGREKKNKSCCVCCLVTLLCVFAVFAASVFYMIKTLPGVNDMVVCRMHLEKVSGAIERYHDSTDKYPESLRELKGEYLRSNDILKCPAHGTEYEYIPSDDANEPVISCKHVLSDKLPTMGWLLYRDGTVETGIENKEGKLIKAQGVDEKEVKIPGDEESEKKEENKETDKR